jgi:2',3'-cyclic-nucleotide 2'-phosphodiesterase (5'-nucleotidase family)
MTASVDHSADLAMRMNLSPKIRNILVGGALIGALVGGHYHDHVPEVPQSVPTSSGPVISVTPTTSSVVIQPVGDGKFVAVVSGVAH